MADPWQEVILQTIDQNKDRYANLGTEIWTKPELGFKEVHAHDLLTSFLQEEGFQVERNFVTPTGFKAVFCADESQASESSAINICFLCEYDAVPGIGHASGHNLSSEASVAAAVAVKTCLEKKILKNGKVTVLGTPAEDCGEGVKIDMIKKGVFKDIDIAMMPAPLNNNITFPRQHCLATVTVSFKGKAAHASAFPWEGRNALDAAIACYTNIALLRQQLKPSWMINGIIKEGGVQPNVVPDHSELQFWLRAPTHMELHLIKQKCTACFVAAAKATGCEANFDIDEKQYYPMQHNEKLGEIYEKHAKALGFEFTDDAEALTGHTGSTDMGNVSSVVPSISPAYNINTHAPLNSTAFTEAAGSHDAQEPTLTCAKALALTAADVIHDPANLELARGEYTVSTSASGNMLVHKTMSSQSVTFY